TLETPGQTSCFLGRPKSVGKCYFVIFFNLQLGTAAMYYNYSAIEEEIEKNKDHPIFAPLYFPSELHRRDALAKNLEYLYGEDWESKISCSAATQPYVDHIHKVGRDDPVLLVAHAWTYYMGDLSRGPVLKKVAQRALKLPPTGEGVNFYHFEGIHNPTAFKRDTKRKNLFLHQNRFGEMLHFINCLPTGSSAVNGCRHNDSPNS
uniref:Heme oxygenase 2a n=1 Tax=Cyprinus carpio TaxID=7962 RepID=A0A8C1W3K4_CYPCA